MIVAILNQIHYVLDENKHSVAYAKRSMSCAEAPKCPTSNWKAVIGNDEEDAKTKMKAQVVSFLQRMNLDPADFKFSYRYVPVDEHGQFWMLKDDGGTYSGETISQLQPTQCARRPKAK